MLAHMNFSERVLQKCPLCNQKQPIVVRGTAPDIEDPKVHNVICDRGYSFCNCRNIYYTDWSNMKLANYDEGYEDKYDTDAVKDLLENYADRYYPMLSSYGKPGGSFLEIGSINEFLLNKFNPNYKTYGMDVSSRGFKNNYFIKANFEFFDTNEKFDVIWASHVFEHFKDPLRAVEKCYDLLTDGGLLFIAMPDPFFIDYANLYAWGHWHIYEHHILWDRNCFIEEVERRGFQCVYKVRNSCESFICVGDYHLIFKK